MCFLRDRANTSSSLRGWETLSLLSCSVTQLRVTLGARSMYLPGFDHSPVSSRGPKLLWTSRRRGRQEPRGTAGDPEGIATGLRIQGGGQCSKTQGPCSVTKMLLHIFIPCCATQVQQIHLERGSTCVGKAIPVYPRSHVLVVKYLYYGG